MQEVVASKAVYKATEAIVITNNEYTRAAKHLARKNGVILWDREALASRLSQTSAKEGASQVAPEVAAPSQTAPAMKMDVVPLADVAACATCHKVLTAAERGYCERNMKDFNGRMLCYRHQRGSRR